MRAVLTERTLDAARAPAAAGSCWKLAGGRVPIRSRARSGAARACCAHQPVPASAARWGNGRVRRAWRVERSHPTACELPGPAGREGAALIKRSVQLRVMSVMSAAGWRRAGAGQGSSGRGKWTPLFTPRWLPACRRRSQLCLLPCVPWPLLTDGNGPSERQVLEIVSALGHYRIIHSSFSYLFPKLQQLPLGLLGFMPSDTPIVRPTPFRC